MSWFCNPELVSTVTQDYTASGPLLFNAIQTFLTAQCLLAPDLFKVPTSSDITKVANTTYDFIVVGGGTAGTVVANRLSEESNWSILLLEAGGNPTLGTEIPALYINNYGTEVDWNFRTESQKNACQNYKDQKCYWPRGKVLGGTSSINGMFYVRGNKEDYNEWSTSSPGWNYDSVLEYFKKSENLELSDKDDDIDMRYHGKNGYLNVRYDTNIHPLENILIKANEQIGIPYVKDINGNTQMGVGRAYTTLKNGKRHSTSNAFLEPIKHRPNLHVLTNAYVEKIIIENKTAKGVNVKIKNSYVDIYTTKEVILSAGTINSPIILLNSGLKPNNDKTNNTEQINVSLPIGENLQDHIYAPIFYKMRNSDKSNSLENIFKAYYQYITEQKGPLSDLSPNKVISFINTIESKSKIPDIQNHFIVAYPNQSNFVDIFSKHRLSGQFYDKFNDLNKDHLIVMIFVTLLKPKSKGTIKLNKKDKTPSILANYLSDHNDLNTLVLGMKNALKLENTAAFKEAGLKLHWIEIDACAEFDNKSDEFLKCIAKHLTGTLYHAVGTNKMGSISDPSSVVDERLRVKFINNLRVIDASVMPNIVRGNTMAAVIMIAEKASDYLKNEWLNKE